MSLQDLNKTHNDNLHEVSVEDASDSEAAAEAELEGSVEIDLKEEYLPKEPEEFSDDKCNLFTSAKYCDLLKIIAESDNEETFLFKKCNRIDLTALPSKQYLEETVVPILIPALQYLIRDRPPEPINALCVYLLKYKSDFEQYCNTEPSEHEEEKK